MDHTRQKFKKEILNHTLEQMDLIDIYRAFHPTAAEYTYFLYGHGIFTRIGHMIGKKPKKQTKRKKPNKPKDLANLRRLK